MIIVSGLQTDFSSSIFRIGNPHKTAWNQLIYRLLSNLTGEKDYEGIEVRCSYDRVIIVIRF
jgi:hypothetical protein